MSTDMKLRLDARAVLQRVNRKLKNANEIVKKARGRLEQEVGEYYRLDLHRNAIIEKDVDLEKLGRELGVLKPYEVIRS